MMPDEAAVLMKALTALRATGQHLELILMAAFDQLRTANAIINKAEKMLDIMTPHEPET